MWYYEKNAPFRKCSYSADSTPKRHIETARNYCFLVLDPFYTIFGHLLLHLISTHSQSRLLAQIFCLCWERCLPDTSLATANLFPGCRNLCSVFLKCLSWVPEVRWTRDAHLKVTLLFAPCSKSLMR